MCATPVDRTEGPRSGRDAGPANGLRGDETREPQETEPIHAYRFDTSEKQGSVLSLHGQLPYGRGAQPLREVCEPCARNASHHDAVIDGIGFNPADHPLGEHRLGERHS